MEPGQVSFPGGSLTHPRKIVYAACSSRAFLFMHYKTAATFLMQYHEGIHPNEIPAALKLPLFVDLMTCESRRTQVTCRFVEEQVTAFVRYQRQLEREIVPAAPYQPLREKAGFQSQVDEVLRHMDSQGQVSTATRKRVTRTAAPDRIVFELQRSGLEWVTPAHVAAAQAKLAQQV
jgi:hypothetical protein